ncbi:MAG: hypothetical protein AAFU79_02800, partial [Myxococcota bacterium]
LKLGYGEDAELEVEFGSATSTGTERPVGTGRVTLVVEPNGWIESTRGERLGESPLRNYAVPAGRRRFVLVAMGGQLRREIELFIEAKRQVVYRYRLGEEDRKPR